MYVSLFDIEQAWALKDPDLVKYIVALADQEDLEPEQPIRDEALTFERFLQTIFSGEFSQKDPEEQKAYRIEQLRLLESDEAEVALPERLKLYKIILLLWSDHSHYARHVLIDIIRSVPMVYGPWRAIKQIYKASEGSNDYQLLAEISARYDGSNACGISRSTLIYMRRRAWRYLRKLGESLPVCYPEAAIHFLAAYTEETSWESTWVANHIFYHQQQRYGSTYFGSVSSAKNLLKNRAFVETWQRSPEPLLRLLGMARSEKVRRFSCDALTQDFKVILRTIEPAQIVSLAALSQRSVSVDNFIVWLLKNAPKLEQHQFRHLMLHDAVISLLESEDGNAQQYAIAYVKSHARDIALSALRRLAVKNNANLVKLVQLFIAERHPRHEIGLEVWGELLEQRHHQVFATQALREYFGRKELTAKWFQQRLLRPTASSLAFVEQNLLVLHPLKNLGIDYFQQIAEKIDSADEQAYQVSRFVLKNMTLLDVSKLPTEFVQMALLNPLLKEQIIIWLECKALNYNVLPIDYYQALVYEPDWNHHAFIQTLKTSKKAWAMHLVFDENFAEQVREWLADIRHFSPADFGFDWLMTLINREEANYHQFASELMTKAFLPADFAIQNTSSSTSKAVPEETVGKVDKNIDLEQKTYLFTGKLNTMTRKEAQVIVHAANGKNHKAVNGKLHFLVIGDEGSPLYGNGRKGSKQVKAEALIEKGAVLRIMSETAFLQKMAGEERIFSDESITKGCQRLWLMASEKPDTPMSHFAIHYIRHHHADICLKLTDRPVDPEAEIPASFATFEQFKPFFQHRHSTLRHLALEFAHYEFSAWQPPSADLIALCESKYRDVRTFVSEALLAEPDADNKGYRLDASQLEVSAVYSFCASKKPETRQLGMQIIQQHEAFQLPDALFHLTESPDRELRAFVVRILWSLYRRYSTTSHWKPRSPVMATMRKKDQRKQKEAQYIMGKGLPERPQNLPADSEALQQLLRRWLYELPPGRLAADRVSTGLKPLSASAAKKALIETFRDIALDDLEFAHMVLPLFENFTHSRGGMEQAACLVAVTRIYNAYPNLEAVV